MIAFSSWLYVFNGIVSLWYGLRSRKVYIETGNEFSRYVFFVGMGVGIAEFFYGVPYFIFFDDPQIVGIFYILAILPLFGGLLFSLKIPLQSLANKKIEYIWISLLSLATVLLFIFHFWAIPKPSFDELGVIYWNIDRFYAVWWSALLALSTLVPAIYFFLVPATTTKAIFKKILFGLTHLLGGMGAILLVLFSGDQFWTIIFFLIQFSGFLVLASIFVTDILLKEKYGL
ncbi:hypothetical protein HYT00_01745 [Candidatus Giovannonibacteria bacterium]|nr:hypothetical protein [Candidatus Giovannonibacteria bacterium]